jgi:hypothetical protein
VRNDARWHLSNGTWAVPGLPPGLASITMIDTNPFITRYLKDGFSANAGGRGQGARGAGSGGGAARRGAA